MNVTVLRRAASAVDALPFSPSSLATAAVYRFVARRRARAATDPEWAAVEMRRRGGPAGTVTLFGDDLTLADWAAQDAIADRVTPDPWWLPAAQRLRHAEVSRVVDTAVAAWQRARRGWADVDTIDLGHHLAGTLGGQLLHLAETAHGWPGTEEFPTFEDWATALRTHGTALVTYAAGNRDADAALNAWYELASDPDADPDAVEAASAAHDAAEAAARAAATAALHWVADHHASLWD